MTDTTNAITVIPLARTPIVPLANESYSRMVITEWSVPETVGSLGYSVFTPGTVMDFVSHDVEEIAFVFRGYGEIRTDDGRVRFGPGMAIHIPPRVWHAVANTGGEDVIMVFGFPYPAYPNTERRAAP